MNDKNKSSLMVPTILGVAVVCMLIAGAYFWWSSTTGTKDDPKKPPIVENPNPNPNPNPNTGVTPIKDKPLVPNVTPVSFGASLDFLDGDQTDRDPLVNDHRRAAALRGLVYKNDKEPFPGVRVSIQNEPRYGTCKSKEDGAYTMRVNGGTLLTVGYQSEGYLPVWRQAAAPWLDYAWVPPVVMTTVDTKVTPVKSGDAKQQAVRASAVKDNEGSRQTTLVFQPGTKATMELADGTKKPLDTLNVRATEYTVGDKGPQRMPAPLPPNSAYTYCVELSADEAIAANARSVQFDKPVIHYVENFLDFPVGSPVPAGYFDTKKMAWVASESGRIIKILEINNGVADIDVAGKGKAADAKELAALKITDDERKELAKLYKAGTSLWRVLIPHFSIWDLNWGFSPPGDAVPPRRPLPRLGNGKEPKRDKVNIPDIDWTFHFHGDRTPGAEGPRTVTIPATGPQIPPSLKRVVIEFYIAGRLIVVELPAKPNQEHVFIWDGKDCFGRHVCGCQHVVIKIGYVYDGVYEQTQRFGASGNGQVITGSRTRQEVVLWQEHQVTLNYFDARVFGLGGWSFDVQHAYDPTGRTLYLGNGERHTASDLKQGNLTITTVAGGGTKGRGNGGPATEARLDEPEDGIFGGGSGRHPYTSRGLAIAPNGVIYIADGTNPARGNNRIRRVDLDGIITTIAGGGTEDLVNGRALDMQLHGAGALALAPDGSLYFVECAYFYHRVRRLSPDGQLTVVAGNLEAKKGGYSGDGGPATKAQMNYPAGLAVAPDGTLYIADQGNHCIRRVSPDGIITTIAGLGKDKQGYSGDGGPAIKAKLYMPHCLAFAPDGSLYFSDLGNYVIRRISPSGIITRVAGVPLADFFGKYSGDDGPALDAKFNDPTGIALAADGSLFIADTNNHCIRRVGPDGVIRKFAGVKATKRDGGFSGDNGPALFAALSHPTELAIGPDTSLYFYDSPYQRTLGDPPYRADRQRIRRISPPLPGFTNTQIAVPSPDGKELHKFNAVGQILETLDNKNKLLRRFSYDDDNQLKRIADSTNDVTVVRDENGRLHAFVINDKKTAVDVNDGGFLERLTFPSGESRRMVYDKSGLLDRISTESSNIKRDK